MSLVDLSNSERIYFKFGKKYIESDDADMFKKACLARIEEKPRDVYLDLELVIQMPSITVGNLVLVWKSLNQTGNKIHIVSAQKRVKEVLQILSLDNIVYMIEEEEEAETEEV